MAVSLRVLLIFVAVFSFGIMLKEIKKFKTQIEYAIFWVIFAILLIIMAVFPGIVSVFSKLLGIYSPANLVFAAIIFLLLIKTFLMTVEISNLETRLKDIAQSIALNEKKRLKEEEAEKK